MRRTALILVTAGLLSFAAAGPAAAASGPVQSIVTGSWWQGQQSGGVIPAPPNVPPKGLWVESEANGPTAISALKLALVDATAPVVHLNVNSAQPASQVAIQACPATRAWKAANAGPWADRPTADCSQVQAAGQLSADAKTMTFDLSAFPVATDGTVDVVFQPAPTAGNLPVSPPSLGQPSAAPTFDATFQPVDASQVATTPANPPVTTPPPTQNDSISAPAFTAPAATFDAPLAAPIQSSANPAFTPPPTTPTSTPTVSAPPTVALAPAAAPRLALSLPKKGLTRRERILIASLVLDVAFFAMYQGYLTPGTSQRRLTIYDDPKYLPQPAIVAPPASRAPSLR